MHIHKTTLCIYIRIYIYMRYRFSPPWAEHKRVGFRGLTLKTQLTWRIIPVSKWVITMVTKSPTWSCSLPTIYLLTEVIQKSIPNCLFWNSFLCWIGDSRFFFSSKSTWDERFCEWISICRKSLGCAMTTRTGKVTRDANVANVAWRDVTCNSQVPLWGNTKSWAVMSLYDIYI